METNVGEMAGMNMESETMVAVAVLGSIAKGSINPSERVSRGEITDERVDEAARNLSRHYEQVDGELRERAIPKWCVDGRPDEEGLPLAPNAAGGTYSLVIGEALIDAQSLVAAGETSATHGKKIFTGLVENGYEVGGHTDTHADAEKCGCGACDRQAEIISYIGDNIDALSDVAAGLGVEVSPELRAKISGNARYLVENKYIASGNEMIGVLREVAGEESVQTLIGPHNEVVLGVSTGPGKTLNRRSLASELGPEYQAH